MTERSLGEMVKVGAQAMRNSRAWPAVFAAGSAELLARVCLTAALAPRLPPDDEYDAVLGRVACEMRKP